MKILLVLLFISDDPVTHLRAGLSMHRANFGPTVKRRRRESVGPRRWPGPLLRLHLFRLVAVAACMSLGSGGRHPPKGQKKKLKSSEGPGFLASDVPRSASLVLVGLRCRARHLDPLMTFASSKDTASCLVSQDKTANRCEQRLCLEKACWQQVAQGKSSRIEARLG